jgi:stage III sporulation protein AB
MERYVLLVGVFLLSVGVGFLIYRRFRERRNFYQSLLSFCNHLEMEIGFSKRTVSEIIGAYSDGYNKNLSKTLQEFRGMIDGRVDITRESLEAVMWSELKPEERGRLLDFLYELGRAGAREECEKIKNARSVFDDSYTRATEALRRDASIYFKICILVGIGMVVLLL